MIMLKAVTICFTLKFVIEIQGHFHMEVSFSYDKIDVVIIRIFLQKKFVDEFFDRKY